MLFVMNRIANLAERILATVPAGSEFTVSDLCKSEGLPTNTSAYYSVLDVMVAAKQLEYVGRRRVEGKRGAPPRVYRTVAALESSGSQV